MSAGPPQTRRGPPRGRNDFSSRDETPRTAHPGFAGEASLRSSGPASHATAAGFDAAVQLSMGAIAL